VFTGLVEDRGALVSRTVCGPGARLVFRSKLDRLKLGESISIDGACLTVAAIKDDTFDVDASHETLSLTTLGELEPGSEVNLERALQVGDRLGGHIVTGHVDGVGTLRSRKSVGESVVMSFSLPKELSKLVAKKGSISVSGVSLTVNEIDLEGFEVTIIPHTLKETTLGNLRARSRVNIEVDLVARYVQRLL
jgi:riboflavin synthase